MTRAIRIIALTAAGERLAHRLLTFMPDASCWYKPRPFAAKVQHAFSQGDALVMICATGIAVRSLAPALTTKDKDPPVLVLDDSGQFVIPLLSGHEGGANDWAYQVARELNAQLVTTTAQPYLQPVYTVGMGCERHCAISDLSVLLHDCLQQAGLMIAQVQSISSIDLKSDELGLINLAQSIARPFTTFDSVTLRSVEHLLSTRSEYVFDTVGVYGVAESAALCAARQCTGQAAELVLNKVKSATATCAIARSYPNNGS